MRRRSALETRPTPRQVQAIVIRFARSSNPLSRGFPHRARRAIGQSDRGRTDFVVRRDTSTARNHALVSGGARQGTRANPSLDRSNPIQLRRGGTDSGRRGRSRRRHGRQVETPIAFPASPYNELVTRGSAGWVSLDLLSKRAANQVDDFAMPARDVPVFILDPHATRLVVSLRVDIGYCSR